MRKGFKSESNPFELKQTFLPKGTAAFLDKLSEERGLPVSKLIAIAVDNEMDATVPFTYLCLVPSTTFVDQAYVAEAGRLLNFLAKLPKGTGRDTLMLCRRDIGIPNRETFMYAYRELLELGLIEEVPVPKRAKFDYPANYKYTRIKREG